MHNINAYFCRTKFERLSNGHKNSNKKLSLRSELANKITLVISYIGVVFSFMGLLSLDCCHFYFLMILKEMLKFLLLSNPVVQ